MIINKLVTMRCIYFALFFISSIISDGYSQVGLDSLEHQKIKFFAESDVTTLVSFVQEYLTKRQKKKLKKTNFEILVSGDVSLVQTLPNTTIQISTEFIKALKHRTRLQLIEEQLGKKGLTYDFMYDYLFNFTNNVIHLKDYTSFSEEEMSYLNSEEFQNNALQLYRYGLLFTICHEYGHIVNKQERNATFAQRRIQESKADKFAIDLLDEMDISPACGLFPIDIFYILDTDGLTHEKLRSHPASIKRKADLHNANYLFFKSRLSKKGISEEEKIFFQQSLNNAKRSYLRIREDMLRDSQRTIDWYLENADKGDDFSQMKVGFSYMMGDNGLSQDNDKALKYLELSARQGNDFSQYWTGIMYQEYLGIYDRALYWLGEAKQQGNVMAEDAYNKLFNRIHRDTDGN